MQEGKPYGSEELPLFCCGDGSGGEHSRDPRLRRAAWAWVQLVLPREGAAFRDDAPAVLRRHRRGAVAGSRQTVNRAELTAFADCLEETLGDLTFVSDSSYVVRQFQKKI